MAMTSPLAPRIRVGSTRSPGTRRGSRPPQMPAETTSGSTSPSSPAAQRADRSAADSPTGTIRVGPRPNARYGRPARAGSSSSRASPAASSSTAVRMRMPFTGLRGRGVLRLLALLALQPGLPRIALGGILAAEQDVDDVAVRDADGIVPLLVDDLDEGLGRAPVAIAEIADQLAPVPPHHRDIAAVVEGVHDHLGEREVMPDVGGPALQGHARASSGLRACR